MLRHLYQTIISVRLISWFIDFPLLLDKFNLPVLEQSHFDVIQWRSKGTLQRQKKFLHPTNKTTEFEVKNRRKSTKEVLSVTCIGVASGSSTRPGRRPWGRISMPFAVRPATKGGGGEIPPGSNLAPLNFYDCYLFYYI